MISTKQSCTLKAWHNTFETYTQSSNGTLRKMGYESANQMADVSDKIRKYIQEIVSTTVASNKQTKEWAANITPKK